MKLQLDSAVSGPGIPGSAVKGSGAAGEAVAGGTPAAKSSAVLAGADGVAFSGVSTALNRLSADRSAKIDRLTGPVQGGSYQISSSATSHALVEDALSGRN